MPDNDYANLHSRMNVVTERVAKAATMYAVLLDYLGSTSDKVVLDIGCSRGTMLFSFAALFKQAIGVDVDKSSITYAKKHHKLDNLSFHHGDASSKLPLDDSSVDVIICNQVYNFVADQDGLMREILRVLKKDGICYFAGVNFYKKDYAGFPTKPLHYFALKKYLKAFILHDYAVAIVKDPKKYGATRYWWARYIPSFILSLAIPLFPSWVFILERRQ